MSDLDDPELRHRQKRSQRAIYRAIASGSDGAKLLAIEGVEATIVPVREWFSIFNSVFYREPPDLERAHPILAAQYESAGVQAWTVWVPPDDAEAASVIQARGHVLDSTPMLFAASVDTLDLESRLDLDLDPEPTWEMVSRVNDEAHGVLEAWS